MTSGSFLATNSYLTVGGGGGGGGAMDIYVHAVKSLAKEPARFVLNNMYNVCKIHIRN